MKKNIYEDITKSDLLSVIINNLSDKDENIIILDIKYLDEVKKIYNKTYKSKSGKSEFRIISSYDVIDYKTMQVYITDEYKDIITLQAN